MKASKQLLMISITFLVLLFSFKIGFSVMGVQEDIGCCVNDDYSIIENRLEQICSGLGHTFFPQPCEEITFLSLEGCCVKELETGRECSYSTQAWCQYNGGNFLPNIEKDSCSQTKNSWGICISEQSITENCTENYEGDQCVEGTIFYCDKNTGKLVPNCNLCKNCYPYACDKSTGKCDLGKIESEVSGETRNCCYFEEQCEEDKRDQSLDSSCRPYTPIGCLGSCKIFHCQLGVQINSSASNKQYPLCWCGKISGEKPGENPYNTSTDTGYCCGNNDDDAYYSPAPCGSAIGNISGYIKDSSGKGIKDARVIVKSELYQRLSPLSDRTGYYEIKDLMPGDYSLIAVAFGYNMQQKNIKLINSSEVNFTLLKPGEQHCTPESLNLTSFSAEHVKGKPFVKLSWTLNQLGCDDIISSFVIKRNDWTASKLIPSNAREFIDQETSWETSYNYSIHILFKGGSSSNILYAEITTGDSVCENVFEGQEFCFNPETGSKKINANHRRTCDQNNKISEVVSNAQNAGTETNCEQFNQVCVVLRNKKTDCKSPSNCLIKGLPLGLFFNVPACLQDFCVYDYSTTNVDACFDCINLDNGQMKTCYDFNSKFACENNNCNLNCTWKYTNLELNKGICYPREEVEKESKCDVCNQLFMHCSSEDCSLLGNCYKNKDSLCVNCEGVRCEDFADKFSCEGNSLTQEACGYEFSNDACNLGICRWNETTNSCFKDGNYDNMPDCAGKEGLFYERCINDTQPPIFSITLQQPLASLVISKDSDEIVFNSNEPIISFLYCFDTQNTCCPNKPLNINQNRNVVFKPKVDEKDFIEANGNNIYYFRYKATDQNYNIAPIKDIKMFVIAYPFEFSLTYGFAPNEDETFDLWILATTSRAAICTYELSPDINDYLVNTTFGTYSSSFQAAFSRISETSYNIVFKCYDLSGNEILFQPNSFRIEYVKDKLINISIETPYYQQDGTPIVSWGSYNVNLKTVPGLSINKVSVYLNKEGNSTYWKDLTLLGVEDGIYTYNLVLEKNTDLEVRNLRSSAGLFVVDATYNGVKVKDEFINGKVFAIYTGLPKPTITIS
ncbi:MAG: carboxypeptidase-like regulatory domain-containing protein [Candidatus Woesearchaeota archaeon]